MIIGSPHYTAPEQWTDDPRARRPRAKSMVASLDPAHVLTIERDRAVRRDLAGVVSTTDDLRRIDSVTLSNGGQRIAFGRQNGGIELVDTATARRVGIRMGHSSAVETLTFSPDDKRLVSWHSTAAHGSGILRASDIAAIASRFLSRHGSLALTCDAAEAMTLHDCLVHLAHAPVHRRGDRAADPRGASREDEP